MNPLQEKLNELIEMRIPEKIVAKADDEQYLADITREMMIYTYRKDFTDLINLTLEEAKKAVPEFANQFGMVGEMLAYDKCRQQTLEALDKMKL